MGPATRDKTGSVLPPPTFRTRLPLRKGSGDVTCPPDLLVCTPAVRPGGPGPTRAITTAGALQDDRRHPRGTKDEIQDGSNARRLPTVYFLQCSTTVPPRFRGERRLPCPHSCAPPFLMTIKGGGRPAEQAISRFFGLAGLSGLAALPHSLVSFFQGDVQGLLSTHPNRLHF